MIRDFLTVTVVGLSLFGGAAQQDGEDVVLNLLAATGDTRRSLSRFLDLYGDRKAGASAAQAAPHARSDWGDFA